MNYSLTDSLKARDASASKKTAKLVESVLYLGDTLWPVQMKEESKAILA